MKKTTIICDECGAEMPPSENMTVEREKIIIGDKSFVIEQRVAPEFIVGTTANYDICAKCRNKVLKSRLIDDSTMS